MSPETFCPFLTIIGTYALWHNLFRLEQFMEIPAWESSSRRAHIKHSQEYVRAFKDSQELVKGW